MKPQIDSWPTENDCGGAGQRAKAASNNDFCNDDWVYHKE